MTQDQQLIVKELALKACEMFHTRPDDIERYCWMVVHEYLHGAMPVEYDVRDIDEALFLNVLNCVNQLLQVETKKTTSQ